MKLETLEQAENRIEQAESNEAKPKKIENLKEILDKVESSKDAQRRFDLKEIDNCLIEKKRKMKKKL